MSKLEFSCICGANWSFANMPSDAAQAVAGIWASEHSGPGHEPTDRDTARRARERDEAKQRGGK